MKEESPPDNASFAQKTLSYLRAHWRGIVLFVVPIVFLPIMLMNNTPEYRCMYLLCVIGIFWITEALPLAVTSMLPILCFPLMNILSSDATCRLYFKDTVVMFVTSIMVALAVEFTGLHTRLALRAIQIIGSGPRRLHFGIIYITMFISMWISNSAATAMMLPIIKAILTQLDSQGLCQMYEEGQETIPPENRKPSRIAMCFYITAAYAASMGGCGTLIGTPTNLTFKSLYETRFPSATEHITFPNFMAYTIPSMLLYTFLTWLWMEWLYMGMFRPNSKDAQNVNVGEEGQKIVQNLMKERYTNLGPTTTGQITVAVLFLTLITLYITRKPGIFTGWGDVIDSKEIKLSSPTVLIVVLCFCMPANYMFLKFWSKDNTVYQEAGGLISWKFIHERTPWGLIFLVGGGGALSEGGKISGMASLLGNQLSSLKDLPNPIIQLFCMATMIILTNFTANVAITNVVTPIIMEMATVIEIHPLYLILPVGLCANMAFLLPVGTPPNAIAALFANIESKQLMIAGIGPSLITLFTIFFFSQTWGRIVFPNLLDYPEWAALGNETQFRWLLEDSF